MSMSPRHFFLPFYNPANETITFTTPAKIITQMGFILNLRIADTARTNNTTSVQFVFKIVILSAFSQNAVTRIDTPADAIIATTAGLSDCKTPCKRSIFLYFR